MPSLNCCCCAGFGGGGARGTVCRPHHCSRPQGSEEERQYPGGDSDLYIERLLSMEGHPGIQGINDAAIGRVMYWVSLVARGGA